MSEGPDMTLWSKRAGLSEPYPLLCHLLDTAGAADVLWRRWLRPGLRDLLVAAISPGNTDLARHRFMFVAGLHDIGKANAVFQGQTMSNHSEEWYVPFRKVLNDKGYQSGLTRQDIIFQDAVVCAQRHEVVARRVLGPVPEQSDDATQTWPQAVVGIHHGRMHNYDDSCAIIDETISGLCAGSWEQQQQMHIAILQRVIGLDDFPYAMSGERAAALLLAAGLTSLSDWFASDFVSIRAGQNLMTDGLNPAINPKGWLVQRTSWLEQHLPQTFSTYEPMADPRQQILGEYALNPSALQVHAETITGGLWLVACPTGDGKTEAALLRHAVRDDEGLIFALPTRSTADAMMDRIRNSFTGTKNQANLSHGFSALNEFYAPAQIDVKTSCEGPDGLIPSEWLSGRLMALLAPVTVSTCDQVLAAGIRQRWTAMRLLATANRHVILDEVHTYDQYQSKILSGLLRWWGRTGTRVTLLSATIPTWQRNMFVKAYSPDHLEINNCDALFPSHTTVLPGLNSDPVSIVARFSYQMQFDSDIAVSQVDAHVDWVLTNAKIYPRARIGVVVNTVQRCVEVADALTQSGHYVLVLHSRMLAGHRDEVSRSISRLIGKRNDLTGEGQGEGIIVVGTQVIEASLDVDFDLITSDLAPATSLVQRAGRLWRHEDSRRSERLPKLSVRSLHVVASGTTTGSLAHRSQAPYLLGEQTRTLAAVRAWPVLEVPKQVQTFVDEAAFSWQDVFGNPGASSGGSEEEIADMIRRIGEANQVILPMDDYLENPNYKTLTVMTAMDQNSEATTRFADTVSGTFILMDAKDKVGYAWKYGLDILASTTDSKLLQAALRAAIPVNGYNYHILYKAHLETSPTWKPKASILRTMLPVDVSRLRSLIYSPMTGLIKGDSI